MNTYVFVDLELGGAPYPYISYQDEYISQFH